MVIFRGPPNPRPKPLLRPKGNIMFKVMMDEREWKTLNTDQLPKQLPMEFIKQFHIRILKTHSQTPDELTRRGGLHPTEICAAMYDKNFFTYWGDKKITDEQTTFAINMIIMKLNVYIKEKAKEGGD